MPFQPESTAVSALQAPEGTQASAFAAGLTSAVFPAVSRIHDTETLPFDPDDLSITQSAQPSINIHFEEEVPSSTLDLLTERDPVSESASTLAQQTESARLLKKRWTPLSVSDTVKILGGSVGGLVGLGVVAGIVHYRWPNVARSCRPSMLSMRRWPTCLSRDTQRQDSTAITCDGAAVELGRRSTAERDTETFGYDSSPLPK